MEIRTLLNQGKKNLQSYYSLRVAWEIKKTILIFLATISILKTSRQSIWRLLHRLSLILETRTTIFASVNELSKEKKNHSKYSNDKLINQTFQKVSSDRIKRCTSQQLVSKTSSIFIWIFLQEWGCNIKSRIIFTYVTWILQSQSNLRLK